MLSVVASSSLAYSSLLEFRVQYYSVVHLCRITAVLCFLLAMMHHILSENYYHMFDVDPMPTYCQTHTPFSVDILLYLCFLSTGCFLLERSIKFWIWKANFRRFAIQSVPSCHFSDKHTTGYTVVQYSVVMSRRTITQ